MNHRAFIPLVLLGFSLLVAALWAYLSTTEEPPPAEWLRRGTAASRTTTVSTRQSFATIDAAQPVESKSPHVQRSHPAPSSRYTASLDFLRLLDDLLVRMRLEWKDSAISQVALGWHALQSDRPALALERFDRLVRLRRENGVAWYGKAAALAALGRMFEAEQAYRQAIQRMPRHPGTRYHFGVLLCRRSRFGEAAEQFRETVALEPTCAPAWYNLASLAQREGRLTEARDGWERVTHLSPDDATAWYHLGVLWMDFDEALPALRCFSIYSALRPNDAEGYHSLAAVCHALGSEVEAADAQWVAEQLTPCAAEGEWATSRLAVSD